MAKKKATGTMKEVQMTKPNVEMYEDIFQIVKNGNEFFIGCANRLIEAKSFETSEAAKKYIDSKPWKLLVNTTCLLYELSAEVLKKQPKDKKAV